MSVRQISVKRDENGNPVYREDTVWWLLKLEDKGQVRLNEKSWSSFKSKKGIVRSVANQSPDPTSIVGNGRYVWQSWLGRFTGRRGSWKIP